MSSRPYRLRKVEKVASRPSFEAGTGQQELLVKSRSGEQIARKRVILGLEPYLDAGVEMYSEATTCEVSKNPKHKWKRKSPGKEGKRGTICGFSRRSRFRLMKKLAECKKGEPCLFITLTVPWSMEADKMKECLWAFYRRLERKFAKTSMVWKMEPHKKGDWHFHAFIYGVKYLPHQVAKSMWQEIIGSHGVKGAYHRGVNLKFIQAGDVQCVRNYVLKYMSKESDSEDFGKWSGRVWGSRGELPRGEKIKHGMSLKEIVWLWRMISRMRKRNVVKMNTTFFADAPEIWIENARILAKINASC